MVRNSFVYKNYVDIHEINRAVKYNAEEFVKSCESDYFSKVQTAADHIAEQVAKCSVVLLAGPSSSGKTTTSNFISERLRQKGIKSETVSMDDYFATISKEDNTIDYEEPERLDIDMLKRDLKALAAGAEVHLPQFDFKTGIQSMSDRIIKSDKDSIVIFEGIHALSDLFDNAEDAIRIYISPRMRITDDDEVFMTPEQLRFIRRCTRDIRFRGADFKRTLDLWPNVIRGERRFVIPSKANADIQIDTSLMYEPCLFAGLSKAQLSALSEDELSRCELSGISQKLERFEILSPSLIPEGSVMREFIGKEE